MSRKTPEHKATPFVPGDLPTNCNDIQFIILCIFGFLQIFRDNFLLLQGSVENNLLHNIDIFTVGE